MRPFALTTRRSPNALGRRISGRSASIWRPSVVARRSPRVQVMAQGIGPPGDLHVGPPAGSRIARGAGQGRWAPGPVSQRFVTGRPPLVTGKFPPDARRPRMGPEHVMPPAPFSLALYLIVRVYDTTDLTAATLMESRRAMEDVL